DGQFILDLAPRHPIYVELIDGEACRAIGRVHRDGEAAKRLLEREGFEASGLIDIFDGGPTMTCGRDNLLTLRASRVARVGIGTPDIDAVPHLLSTVGIDAFRAVQAHATVHEDVATIDADTARALGVGDNDRIRISNG
ncbi:MAG: arginine N-succinyltransferase, partial [Rhizorhabdus sp.]